MAFHHITASVKSCLWPGLITGACLVMPTSSQAGLDFIGNGNVILNANGGGNNFYAVDSYNNPTFNGGLNGLAIQAGQNLLLGGQIQTHPGFAQTGAASSAAINYLIVGTGISGQLNLPFAYNVGNNDLWEQSSAGNEVNLDQGLSTGTYTLNIWFSAVANDGTGTSYDGTSGSPYSATFEVVPEPINLALPIFGGLVITVGLARRFAARRTEPA
jgi:hypothetical protein